MAQELKKHPLNQVAQSLLQKFKAEPSCRLMPVLELAFQAALLRPQAEQSHEAMLVMRHAENEAGALGYLQEYLDPEDLQDINSLEEAGNLVLSELEPTREASQNSV